MILPSIELLSEVFGANIVDCNEELGDIDFTEKRTGYFLEGSINIYELANKCKIKALEKGWHLSSGLTNNEGAYCDCTKPPSKEFHIENSYNEAEAIFKAYTITMSIK